MTCAERETVIRAGYGIFRLYPNYGRTTRHLLEFGFGATLAVTSTNSASRRVQPG